MNFIDYLDQTYLKHSSCRGQCDYMGNHLNAPRNHVLLWWFLRSQVFAGCVPNALLR